MNLCLLSTSQVRGTQEMSHQAPSGPFQSLLLFSAIPCILSLINGAREPLVINLEKRARGTFPWKYGLGKGHLVSVIYIESGAVPAESDKFFKQPNILKAPRAKTQSCRAVLSRQWGSGQPREWGEVHLSLKVMSWHQWDSALGWIWDGRCKYQSSPHGESSHFCPLLIPVHRLQNLFSLSPLFCKQGPKEGAVLRAKVQNNNVTLPSFPYPDETN